MSQATIPLLYACSFAGLVMVVGGIWLIAREKIYIDRETREVTAIELPFGVKLQTNLPALALFVLGFVPLIYPMTYAAQLVDQVRLNGEVSGDQFPVEVYAVVEWESLRQPGNFSIPVPGSDLKRSDYKLLYISRDNIVDRRPDLSAMANGVLPVPPAEFWNNGQPDYVRQVDSIPEEFR